MNSVGSQCRRYKSLFEYLSLTSEASKQASCVTQFKFVLNAVLS